MDNVISNEQFESIENQLQNMIKTSFPSKIITNSRNKIVGDIPQIAPKKDYDNNHLLDELMNKNKELQAENQRLKDKVENIQSLHKKEISELNSKVSHFKQLNVKANDELRELREQNQTRESRSEISQLKQQLNEQEELYKTRISRLNAVNNRLKSDLNAALQSKDKTPTINNKSPTKVEKGSKKEDKSKIEEKVSGTSLDQDDRLNESENHSLHTNKNSAFSEVVNIAEKAVKSVDFKASPFYIDPVDILTNLKPRINPLQDETLLSRKVHDDGKIEKTFGPFRRRIIEFTNGTIKEIVPTTWFQAHGFSGEDYTNSIVYVFFSKGDVKKLVLSTNRVVYYYRDVDTTQVTYNDDTQIFKFHNGQIEIHKSDQTKLIRFPDGTEKEIWMDGKEKSRFPDGTTQTIDSDGKRHVVFANGQQEISFANGMKKRIYTDGTIKNIFDDRTETLYPDGRKRIKTKDGSTLFDGMA
eukprot:TRINITY_DN2784_c0_g1_i1.p1 TRINITY_DN2784_c0_g1~~TRINITY_DN2784_c0_g1_i1.p1  ORF type:complete len:510 (+),score=141.75 TRINITY_DN2784_c0_g1_i1:118-1530(+)